MAVQHTREQYSLSVPVGAGLVHPGDLAAAHAVDEGHRPGSLPVDQHVPTGGPLGIEHALELRQGDHALGRSVPVLALARLVVVVAGGHDDGTDLEDLILGHTVDLDAVTGGQDALAAAGAVGPVDGVQFRHRAWMRLVEGLARGDAVVELVGHHRGAGLDRETRVRERLVHAARFGGEGDAEVTEEAGLRGHARGGTNLDALVGHDLIDEAAHQGHGRLVGGIDRTQLHRAAAEEGRLLDERDGLAHGGGVERSPQAGHAAADDEDAMDGIDTQRLQRFEQA